MPLAGVICGADGSYQPFEACINCHENGGKTCHAPVQVLKIMRDNHLHRKHAGWSASTMTNCARAMAIQALHPYYESVEAGYNKARGEWVHAMIESDKEPRPGLIREVRFAKDILIGISRRRVTGKPDEVDTHRGILIDYKSKHLLPKKPDPKHEAQFNVYAWLLQGGRYVLDDGALGDEINVVIKSGGMHYLTWHTKTGMIWKKMAYPVWSLLETEEFIIERMTPLLDWEGTGILPDCNAYIRYSKKWLCDCVRLEEQLNDRGIWL